MMRGLKPQPRVLLLGAFAAIFLSAMGCRSLEADDPLADSFEQLVFEKAPKRNSKKWLENPKSVLLISIDGFRHDYLEKYQPKFLSRFAKSAIQAKALLPVFPSKTFPNHYSIVTGLRASQHGIVANRFYDSKEKRKYSMANKSTVRDGSWYRGEPVWVTAAKSGMVTASYFWIGSEAVINGMKPTYSFFYKDVEPSVKVDRVAYWLNKPFEERPLLTTLYFHDVDRAGHHFGPDSKEVALAIENVDRALSKLFDEIKGANPFLNTIILSDHGMLGVSPQKHLLLPKLLEMDSILQNSKITTLSQKTMVSFYGETEVEKKKLLEFGQKAQQKNTGFEVYFPKDLKEKWDFDGARIGDLLLVARPGYLLFLKKKKRKVKIGHHGYDPKKSHEMGGIFLAKGPFFNPPKLVPEFENILVYDIIVKILGLSANPQVNITSKERRSVVEELIRK